MATLTEDRIAAAPHRLSVLRLALTGAPLWLVIPAVVGFALLLLTEHRQHILDFLPFLILPSCPLMHLFMHHGHGGNSRDSAPARSR